MPRYPTIAMIIRKTKGHRRAIMEKKYLDLHYSKMKVPVPFLWTHNNSQSQ